MTPEEYAAQALIYFLAANGRVPEADHSLFESAAIHYVRAAVEAERERCACIADAAASDYPSDVFLSGAGAGARHAAECIAHAIRNS